MLRNACVVPCSTCQSLQAPGALAAPAPAHADMAFVSHHKEAESKPEVRAPALVYVAICFLLELRGFQDVTSNPSYTGYAT